MYNKCVMSTLKAFKAMMQYLPPKRKCSDLRIKKCDTSHLQNLMLALVESRTKCEKLSFKEFFEMRIIEF